MYQVFAIQPLAQVGTKLDSIMIRPTLICNLAPFIHSRNRFRSSLSVYRLVIAKLQF